MNEEASSPGPSRPRIRIGVIFGGRSGEHEVSLESAQSVMKALDPARYEVVPIGIDRAGRWLVGEAMQALRGGEARARPATLLPDPSATGLMAVSPAPEHALALSSVAELDVIFPVLHGPYGEDGTVQGLLELAGIPYVGAGVVGSAVGMDKAIFKQVMAANDIPVLPWVLVLASRWAQERAAILDDIEARLQYPVFTKPANLGSSVGISKCPDRAALAAGLDAAAAYDRRIIVEQGASIRELEVAILGNDEPEASVVGEVRPQREFYDYVAKYVSDDSELLIPAPIPDPVAANVRELALRAYRAIDGAGLARVDLMLERDGGQIYVNEINTIPGFTRISMYPKLWEATGLPYPELLDRLVALAQERHRVKRGLRTSFSPGELPARQDSG